MIQKKVKEVYEKLPPGQKKVAEYLLENTYEYGMSTAAQISARVNVSETTVIRLSYALGFGRFSDLQRFLQKEFLKGNEQPFMNDDVETNDSNFSFLINTVKKDIAILEKLKSTINFDEIDKVADTLMEADEIKIAGYRASYSVAHWFYLKLSMMRDNVVFLPSDNISNGDPNHFLLKEDLETVYFLLSFPSYVTETIEIAKFAKQQKKKIIAVSDRITSPVGRISDICLITDINVGSENLASLSSVHSLLNLVAVAIEKKFENEVEERIRRIYKFYSDTGTFLE